MPSLRSAPRNAQTAETTFGKKRLSTPASFGFDYGKLLKDPLARTDNKTDMKQRKPSVQLKGATPLTGRRTSQPITAMTI